MGALWMLNVADTFRLAVATTQLVGPKLFSSSILGDVTPVAILRKTRRVRRKPDLRLTGPAGRPQQEFLERFTHSVRSSLLL